MKVTSIGEGLEKLESWCVVSENVEWISPLENSLAVSQKSQTELPNDPPIALLGVNLK